MSKWINEGSRQSQLSNKKIHIRWAIGGGEGVSLIKSIRIEEYERFSKQNNILEPQDFIYFLILDCIVWFEHSSLCVVPCILFKYRRYGNGLGTKSRRTTNVFMLYDDVDCMQWSTIDRKLRGKLMMITMIVGFIVHL